MSEPFIGQLMLVPYNFVPAGWAACDGRLLPIAQNAALFSLLGVMYGGDGSTTFGLPDLRGRVPISVGQGQGLSAYALGAKGGAEGVTLTTNQMPVHNHRVAASAAPLNTPSPQNAFPGGDGAYQELAESTVTMNPAMVLPAGESQPHENRQPYLALQWIIALQGIYPSRG